MNKNLILLNKIFKKSHRLIIGLMSGTSLDGLDIALCECTDDSIKIKEFKTYEYTESLRAQLRSIQSKQTVNLQNLCILNTQMAHLHAKYILDSIKEWGMKTTDIDLIASHGQTVYHNPSKDLNSTLQIIDGDHIAQLTNIITISDFRQKHVAAGGEGAPLVALMDEKLYRHTTTNRMLLNLGGISNFTWLPSVTSNLDVLTSDVGPANTLINEAMQKYYNKPYDEGGETAKIGKVHSELLKYLLLEPFFRKPFPKTTGQEDFNLALIEEIISSYSVSLEPQDLIATLTQLTVYSISRAFEKITNSQDYELYVSGGGIYNTTIMNSLAERLEKAEIKPFEKLGMQPDAKEAALMAFLADNMLSGNKFEIAGKEIGMGKICLPN